jgi:hypothetical protein
LLHNLSTNEARQLYICILVAVPVSVDATAPEEVMRRWAREWIKESVALGPNKRLPAEGPWAFLPRRPRWSVRSQEDEIRDYERLA